MLSRRADVVPTSWYDRAQGEDKAERVNKEVATAAAPADLVPIRVPVAGEAPKAGSGG